MEQELDRRLDSLEHKHFAYRCSACNWPFLTVARVHGHIRKVHGRAIVRPRAVRFECSAETILALRGKRGQLPLWVESDAD